MRKEIRKKLIELARLKTAWTYSQLNDQLGLGLHFEDGHDRELVGEWLREISIHEFKRERPLLGLLIVQKAKDKEQGVGFYKSYEAILGIPWRRLKEDDTFEIEKMKECYTFWKDDDNYRKYRNDC